MRTFFVPNFSECFVKDQSRVVNKLLEILEITERNEELVFKQLQSIPAETLIQANIQLAFVSSSNVDNKVIFYGCVIT